MKKIFLAIMAVAGLLTASAQYKAPQVVANGGYHQHASSGAKNTMSALKAAQKGKFYGSEGKTYALKNVVAEHSSSSSELGGLFGGVAKDAEIKNVTFENATLDISSTKARMQEGRFGLFAGNIADGAKISGVTVSGTVRVGEIDWVSETCLLNLLANGQTTGITKGEIKLQIYGNLNWATGNTYYYTINPDTVTVDGNGNVSMVYEYGQEFGFEFKDINIE